MRNLILYHLRAALYRSPARSREATAQRRLVACGHIQNGYMTRRRDGLYFAIEHSSERPCG